MSDEQGAEPLQASDDWLEAAINVGMQLRVAYPNTEKDLWPVHFNLLMLSRAQYAAELSYERFRQGAATEEASESRTSSLEGIERTLRGYLEVHAFLVSAHLYWRSLQAVSSYLVAPEELSQVLHDSEELISHTATARHHMEHITERIGRGRTGRYGTEMSAEVFRQSLGRIEGSTVVFGEERFDLAAIHEAIRSIGEEVAPLTKAAIPFPVPRLIQDPPVDEGK
jgi:hypothetical protein